MVLIDFNDLPQNDRMYGGVSGNKVGVAYKGDNFLLKFPGSLKSKGMKNVQLSYSNAPVCEYLGSHIYDLLDIPVHDTLLGTRNGKVVVACKDFLERGDRLYEFREIKTTFEPLPANDDGHMTDGNGTELADVLHAIYEHPFLQDIHGVQERFWDMFVVDAFIGNSDRNNGNWGVIVRYDGSKELAPVYDNGACLNNKWDDEKMQRALDDDDAIKAQAYHGVVCAYMEQGKRINPFHFMERTDLRACKEAVRRIVPRISQLRRSIGHLVEACPLLSDVQKKFYNQLFSIRLEKALLPLHKKMRSAGVGR